MPRDCQSVPGILCAWKAVAISSGSSIRGPDPSRTLTKPQNTVPPESSRQCRLIQSRRATKSKAMSFIIVAADHPPSPCQPLTHLPVSSWLNSHTSLVAERNGNSDFDLTKWSVGCTGCQRIGAGRAPTLKLFQLLMIYAQCHLNPTSFMKAFLRNIPDCGGLGQSFLPKDSHRLAN